jgi:magnesium-transporting ATPase (P-type)
MNWHLQSIETTIEALRTQPETGLSQDEVDLRLTQYGRNELVDKGRAHPAQDSLGTDSPRPWC